ncbi:dynein light intermediate chain-domain-containing protein [Polychytrium aggregatum]|uniref:dynein light intermediate chain-domain-containing protein n=1 Tax=Polychytrium aggregatum TaxID=110093 RepID=UPI0022FE8DD1|nr:dynein light intermediate chain-domain-containing protein [Polychytrium aggregatum]KAI9199311.1 dynein light intermediate chain-domain-containing protein [Polychytrium aggregatum]
MPPASIPSHLTTTRRDSVNSQTEPPTSPTRLAQEDADDLSPADIWASILKSVSSSKVVPTKNIIVVGDSNSGKSTISNAIKNPNEYYAPDSSELALSYSFAEVNDDGDVIARIGIYQIAGDTQYQSAIPHVLDAEAICDALIVVVLDWNKPWSFVESLEKWLSSLEDQIKTICSKNKGQLEELQERVESFWRNYAEPSDAQSTTGSLRNIPSSATEVNSVAGIAAARDVVLPLEKGVLMKNLGVPVVVVAGKADAHAQLEKDKDFKEEQFDFIQQVLRSICLKYGAALFYTSSHRIETIRNLRGYILHRLFAKSSAASEHSDPFRFTERANVLERDTLLVPAGWDSWGKIKIIKGDFQPNVFSSCDEDGSLAQGGNIQAALDAYAKVIKNPKHNKGLKPKNSVLVEDEQKFLEKQLETLQSSVEQPPTGDHQVASTGNAGAVPAPSTVIGSGPYAHHRSANSDLLEDISAKLNRLKAKEPSLISTVGRDKMRYGTESVALPAGMNMSPTSATSGSSIAGIPGSSALPSSNQNEVLSNFFQSLLNKKGTSISSTSSDAAMSRSQSQMARSMSHAAREREREREPNA